MYGESGAAMRQALAELLRQHRVQQRLGGTPADRAELGQEIRQYRQTVLIWSHQALTSVSPLTFSNQAPVQPNPFRSAGTGRSEASPAGEFARAIAVATTESTARPASVEQLTTSTGQPSVELWRAAARCAALAEHDTATHVTAAMTAPQAQAVVADVAAIAQALVVLDQRYRCTPGWEPLAQGGRLGWAALAAALDVNLGQPDYTVDALGWRPKTKPIDGPARPGVLGVLQAEHNLVVRLKSFPNATSLRYVIDSQRLLSRHLVPFAERIDPLLAEHWSTRAATYTTLQRLFRSIGGRAGGGGSAAADGATALGRLRALPPETIVEPRTLGAFQLLFDRLDQRIATIVEDGIDERTYFQREQLPRLVEGSGGLISPVRERFVPVDRTTNPELIQIIRRDLVPKHDLGRLTPGDERAALHAALVHRAVTAARRPGPSL